MKRSFCGFYPITVICLILCMKRAQAFVVSDRATKHNGATSTNLSDFSLRVLDSDHVEDVSSPANNEFADQIITDDSQRRMFLSTFAASCLILSSGIEPSNAAGIDTTGTGMGSRSNKELSDRKGNKDIITSTSSSNVLISSSSANAIPLSSATKTVDWKPILQKASKRALGGGKAGASAAVVQVFSLMWLRTSMNYQYRYGGDLSSSLKTLWDEGGIQRLYQGLPFALVQGPLSRFGDTAANVGILALLESTPETSSLPLPIKTACGSIAAGLWRIFLMPIDTSKTSMQVEGADGLKNLWNTVVNEQKSLGPLYRGALASAAATTAGHFPWYLTYNFLNEQFPNVSNDDLLLSLARAALIGLCSSCVSDCTSNSLRVIKTTKQTANLGLSATEDKVELSYPDIVKLIVDKDGVIGLFGRGLQTRLLTNAIQGAVFSILWKYFQQAGI